MFQQRAMEFLGLLMIGDGVLALLYPRRHPALWRGGPRTYREAIDFFTRNPELTRLLGGLEVALGLWLARKQFP